MFHRDVRKEYWRIVDRVLPLLGPQHRRPTHGRYGRPRRRPVPAPSTADVLATVRLARSLPPDTDT
jgi:hypothetical protein